MTGAPRDHTHLCASCGQESVCFTSAGLCLLGELVAVWHDDCTLGGWVDPRRLADEPAPMFEQLSEDPEWPTPPPTPARPLD